MDGVGGLDRCPGSPARRGCPQGQRPGPPGDPAGCRAGRGGGRGAGGGAPRNSQGLHRMTRNRGPSLLIMRWVGPGVGLTKTHMAVDARGRPLPIRLSAGQATTPSCCPSWTRSACRPVTGHGRCAAGRSRPSSPNGRTRRHSARPATTAPASSWPPSSCAGSHDPPNRPSSAPDQDGEDRSLRAGPRRAEPAWHSGAA